MHVQKKYVTCGLILFSLATACKYAFNELGSSFDDLYNSPQARSSASAKRQAVWSADLKIEPVVLTSENITFEFEEAWLEAGYEPKNFLIWFPWRKRAKWDYLCVRPKTHWFQGSYSFVLAPQFDREFVITGIGRNGTTAFTLSGNDLYFQKVPTDLRNFNIDVSINNYGKGKDITLGTASFHRSNTP